jgi:hypothetical protein
MTHSDSEKLPNYTGMQVGGWTATAAGGLGLPTLLTVGFMSKAALPTGLAGMVIGATTIGAILLACRMVMRQGNEHRLDVIQSTTAIFDEMRVMRDEMAEDRADRKRVIDLLEKALSHEPGTPREDATGPGDSRPVSRKTPRQRRRRREGADAGGDNVVPMRARRAADALRRLNEKLDPPTQ